MNNKIEILKKSLTIGMLGVVLVLAITGTKSWFTVNRDVDISSMDLNATLGEDIMVSLDGKNWGYTLDYSELLSNVYFTEITSLDGGQTLMQPIKDGATGLPVSDINSWEEAVANIDYIEVEFYVKASSPMNLYLDYERTIISPDDDDDEKTVLMFDDTYTSDTYTIINQSEYGDFSKNYVAGASRIGVYDITEYDSESESEVIPSLISVFASNPFYHLTTTVNEDTGAHTFKFAIDTNYETYMRYDIDEDSETFGSDIEMDKDADYYPKNIISGTETTYSDDNFIIKLDLDENGNSIIYKLQLLVWVDGCDREAKEALQGGKMDISIMFVGRSSSAEDSVEDEVTEDA